MTRFAPSGLTSRHNAGSLQCRPNIGKIVVPYYIPRLVLIELFLLNVKPALCPVEMILACTLLIVVKCTRSAQV